MEKVTTAITLRQCVNEAKERYPGTPTTRINTLVAANLYLELCLIVERIRPFDKIWMHRVNLLFLITDFNVN